MRQIFSELKKNRKLSTQFLEDINNKDSEQNRFKTNTPYESSQTLSFPNKNKIVKWWSYIWWWL